MHSTWSGFLFMIFMVTVMVSTWGEPDVIDESIYSLSDGYDK